MLKKKYKKTYNDKIISVITVIDRKISASFGLILLSLPKLNIVSDVMIYTLNG